MIKKLLCGVLCTTLIACTTISKDNKVFATPKTPVIHYVYLGEMLSKCYKYTPVWMMLLGGFPLACAEWTDNICDIYISENAPDWMLEHELQHCNGFGH